MNKVPFIKDNSHIIKVQESSTSKVIVVDNSSNEIKVSLAITTI